MDVAEPIHWVPKTPGLNNHALQQQNHRAQQMLFDDILQKMKLTLKKHQMVSKTTSRATRRAKPNNVI